MNNISLRIYPNPMDGELNIENNLSINKLEIYNILGVKVFSICPNQKILKIGNLNLKKGIYVLNIDNEKRKIIIK
jgi:hypothetical protein